MAKHAEAREIFQKSRDSYLSTLEVGSKVRIADRGGLVEHGNYNEEMESFVRDNRIAVIREVLRSGEEFHFEGSKWYWFHPWIQLPSENDISYTGRDDGQTFYHSVESLTQQIVELAIEDGVKNDDELLSWLKEVFNYSRSDFRKLEKIEDGGVRIVFSRSGQEFIFPSFE